MATHRDGIVQHHPFTEYWPLLSGENFEKFKADIAANGLRMPILTYQDQILDGRNRERACEETGVPARYEDCSAKSDEEALMLVVSLNEHRRHLSDDERLFAASRLAQMQHGGDRKSIKLPKESLIQAKVITLEKAAKLMDVSFGSATRARTILKHGTKEDEQDVLSGKVSLSKKDEEIRKRVRLPKSDVQRRDKNGVPVWGKHNRPVIIPSKKTLAERRKPQPMLTIPLRDVTERLGPIIKTLKQQSRCSMATVSFSILTALAGQLEHLVEDWTGGGTELERTPNSANSTALDERKAL